MKTITLSQLGLNLKGIIDILDQFHGLQGNDDKTNELLKELNKIDKQLYQLYLKTLK